MALLRAVNVGGTGVLPMQGLQAICAAIGLRAARTYIQSGNVVFESDGPERKIVAELERALRQELGRPVGVLVRTGAERRAVLEANPFGEAEPAKVGVTFLPEPAPDDLLANVNIPGREQLRLGRREIYVHYPDGMGRSKLKLPEPAAGGTARNLNTVAKLVAMTGQ